MKTKVLLVVILLMIAISLFLFYKSEGVELEGLCENLIEYYEVNNKIDISTLDNIVVGVFSRFKYYDSEDDFIVYSCDNFLSPCEVCTFKDGYYYDEI